MSAAHQSRRRPTELAPPAADISELRTRRRQARRRRRLVRIDLGLGVTGGLVLLLASPGLAITLLIAVLVLAVCGISILVQQRMRRRIVKTVPARRRSGSSVRGRT